MGGYIQMYAPCVSVSRVRQHVVCLRLGKRQSHPDADAAVALADSLFVHSDVSFFQGLVDLDS